MILKFRSPIYKSVVDPENPERDRQVRGSHTHQWSIYGEVSQVHFSSEPIDEDDICPPPGSQKPQIRVDEWIRDPDEHAPFFMIVHFDTPQGRKTVAFNTVAYLCNDKGDTVEKISFPPFHPGR